eukprot:g6206.t1
MSSLDYALVWAAATMGINGGSGTVIALSFGGQRQLQTACEQEWFACSYDAWCYDCDSYVAQCLALFSHYNDQAGRCFPCGPMTDSEIVSFYEGICGTLSETTLAYVDCLHPGGFTYDCAVSTEYSDYYWPEPAPEPSPEPTPEPAPEPTPEPAPEPTSESPPEPTPAPIPGTRQLVTPAPAPNSGEPLGPSGPIVDDEAASCDVGSVCPGHMCCHPELKTCGRSEEHLLSRERRVQRSSVLQRHGW